MYKIYHFRTDPYFVKNKIMSSSDIKLNENNNFSDLGPHKILEIVQSCKTFFLNLYI